MAEGRRFSSDQQILRRYFRRIFSDELSEAEALSLEPSNKLIVGFYQAQIEEGKPVSVYVEGMLIRGEMID